MLTLVSASPAGAAGEDTQWSPSNNVNFAVQMTHMVSLTSYVNGQLTQKRTTRDEIARCCPGCVNWDGQRYFDGVPTLDRTIVNACAARSSVGTTTYVKHTFEYMCKKTGMFRADIKEVIPVNYWLSHQADGVHIGLKVRANFDPSLSRQRADFMLERTQACVPLIKKLWAGYGITFDLQYDSDRHSTPGKPDAETRISDATGRSYSNDYDFLGLGYAECIKKSSRAESCENARQKEYCERLAHETGHLLGFGDEYEDKDLCPDRDILTKHAFPFSPMGYDHVGFDNLEFFPEHIRQVIGPLCR